MIKIKRRERDSSAAESGKETFLNIHVSKGPLSLRDLVDNGLSRQVRSSASHMGPAEELPEPGISPKEDAGLKRARTSQAHNTFY